MKHEPAKRSSLFLLELLIAILFFSLSAAVCVRFLAKAHTLSENAHNLNMAVSQVSAYAERFRAGDNFQEVIAKDGSLNIYYDDGWEICKEEDGIFCLTVQITSEGSFQSAVFSLKDLSSGEELFGTALDKYIAGEGNL